MSDALPLPPRPDIEQYRKLARDLQQACRSAEPDAIRQWALHWLDALDRLLRAAGAAVFPNEVTREARRVEHRFKRFSEEHLVGERCRLSMMQFFIAREHGFDSWPRFHAHLDGLAQAASPAANFEAAADAIVSGGLEALRRLLREDPALVRARSTREHRSTLLHYVSANGIEDFRQRTPPNILDITQLLLDAGADVNAESGAYGGGSTALGLTATSWHPEHAGVQVPLMQLLIRYGARIDGPDSPSAVNACLHNGRGEAAAHLASLGAQLDLEGAAGVGRLDVVRTFFDDQGRLRPPTDDEQLKRAFLMACQFGRTEVVRFLLDHGAQAGKLLADGETGLHWAAYGGHVDTVRMLLERGAEADAVERTYGGRPIDWALYAWGGSVPRPHDGYYEVVRLLAPAGARIDEVWYEADPERQRALARLRADPRMRAALAGDETAERTEA